MIPNFVTRWARTLAHGLAGRLLILLSLLLSMLAPVGVSPVLAAPRITGAPVVTQTSTSFTVTWSTDIPASGEVVYGTTSSYGQTSSQQQNTYSTNHSVTVNGLTPNTTYHWRVQSRDAAGNVIRDDQDRAVQTNAPSASSGAAVTLSPTTAKIGTFTQIGMVGNGFPSGIAIRIEWSKTASDAHNDLNNREILGSVRSGSNGSFSVSVAPPQINTGLHIVYFVEDFGGGYTADLATAAFLLLPKDTTSSSPSAAISLDPTSGPPGTNVTVRATGFNPQAEVVFVWGAIPGGTILWDGTADTSGAHTQSVTIPFDAPSGGQAITVFDAAHTMRTATFSVSSAPATIPTSTALSGTWISPNDGDSFPLGPAITLSAQLTGNAPVDHVNFTGSADNGATWQVLCPAPPPSQGSTYSCTWSASGQPGNLLLSFDVYPSGSDPIDQPGGPRTIHLTFPGGCISGGAQGPGCVTPPPLPPLAKCDPTSTQTKFPHHYVVFLLGINSDPPGADGKNANFDQDMGDIKGGLCASGYTTSQFVYFSYGALANVQDGDLYYCGGWGPDACDIPQGASPSDPKAANLNDINRTAIYQTDATHRDIKGQADVLDWLLGQILRKDNDPSVQIDIVTHSLGGVVAAYWGATHDNKTETGTHIHSIVLIESPVGGLALNIDEQQHPVLTAAAYPFLMGFAGTPVLSELTPGTSDSIVPTLPRAAQIENGRPRYAVTAIQSGKDFYVSGEPLVIGAKIGYGAQAWSSDISYVSYTKDFAADLGSTTTTERPDVQLGDNHLFPLHDRRTIDWVVSAVKPA